MSIELIRKPASATNDGELDSSSAQTISGAKTFTGALTASSTLSVSGALTPSGGIVGRTDGVAVPAGQIGEMSGTLRNGTGGSSYSTRSTTTVTSSATLLNSISLNKGVYLVSGAVQTLQLDGAARRLICYLAVGGTQIQNGVAIEIPNSALQTILTGMVPIVITTDGTTVGLFGQIVSLTGGTNNNNHEMFAIRIA